MGPHMSDSLSGMVDYSDLNLSPGTTQAKSPTGIITKVENGKEFFMPPDSVNLQQPFPGHLETRQNQRGQGGSQGQGEPGQLSSMAVTQPHYPPSSHGKWPPSPSGSAEEFEHYSFRASPACEYNPSPLEPRGWVPPAATQFVWNSPVDHSSPLQHQQPSQPEVPDNCLRLCTPGHGFNDMDAAYPKSFYPGFPEQLSPVLLDESLSSATTSPRELNSPAMPAGAGGDAAARRQNTRKRGLAGILASPESPLSPTGSTSSPRGSAQKNDEPHAQLIYRAFMSVPGHSMTLQELYEWFERNTNKAKGGGKGWQNSIRHNLSMNKAFAKRERPPPISNDSTVENPPTASSEKRISEWVLTDWAVREGVYSTTRYRPKNQHSSQNQNDGRRRGRNSPPRSHHLTYHPHHQHSHQLIPGRAMSGRKGGCTTSVARLRHQHDSPSSSTSNSALAVTGPQIPMIPIDLDHHSSLGMEMEPGLPTHQAHHHHYEYYGRQPILYEQGYPNQYHQPHRTPGAVPDTRLPTPMTPESPQPDMDMNMDIGLALSDPHAGMMVGSGSGGSDCAQLPHHHQHEQQGPATTQSLYGFSQFGFGDVGGGYPPSQFFEGDGSVLYPWHDGNNNDNPDDNGGALM